MLSKARAAASDLASVRFEARDLATGWPGGAADVVYSNAALHWLTDHASLFPRLARTVAGGGVLAVQMPRNFDAPSHVAVAEVATSERWRGRLATLVRASPVAAPEAYFRWLEPHCASVDVWETIYLQRLAARDDGEHPVVAFVSGSWLLPFFDRLGDDAEARRDFLGDYRERIARAYPREPDGSTLFPFRRLFVVAVARTR
jgi:trans-aconitate 2-methyltransferase